MREFMIFSLLVAFVVTCNMVLFLHNATISEEDIRRAAPATFINVFIIAGIFTLIDRVRRYYQITRPVKKIQEGLNQVMKGDFTTQLQKFSDSSYAYDTIIASINVMIKELGSVETLGNDFISNVSHEIKTPLAVMQNYATLLEAPDLTDEKRLEYAQKIMEQTRRMSFLITNILKLNKLENQQIFPQMEKLDLGDVDGVVVSSNSQSQYSALLSQNESDMLESLMSAAVSYGTCSKLSGQSYSAYGKTGTAEVSDTTDQTNAWFVGYAKKNGYQDIAVAVVVEKSGAGSTYAVPIAKKIFDVYFNR